LTLWAVMGVPRILRIFNQSTQSKTKSKISAQHAKNAIPPST